MRNLFGNHRRALAVMAALLVPLALTATAFAKEPTGEFAKFKQCPRFTTGVNSCLWSQVVGGKVTLNKQTVPIENPITLQFGLKVNEETGTETVVGALNGETLSKTPENIPGGLSGLVNCTEILGNGFLEVLARETCKAIFENKTTGVRAITELAKPASEITFNKSNEVNQEGTALGLPVKVRLENPLLGSECYIGSSSSPVQLNLTSGTTSPNEPNKPIKGKVGELEFRAHFEIIEITKAVLVNNEFSAPGATGCGGIFSFLLDPIINSKIGLPSTDGHNTAIQEANVFLGVASGVIESEK